RSSISTLFPYTTLFRSSLNWEFMSIVGYKNSSAAQVSFINFNNFTLSSKNFTIYSAQSVVSIHQEDLAHPYIFHGRGNLRLGNTDRKSTRLNSSHVKIS